MSNVARTRHPRTGAPLLRHEVHTLGYSGKIGHSGKIGPICGIVPAGEAGEGFICEHAPVADFIIRYACGGFAGSPICAEHLAGIVEQLAASEDSVSIITPGLN